MNKLNINLENCYGIKKLCKEFDFSKKNTYAIYAPNGTMKTSFAKTFKDLSENINSMDLVFKDRKTIREIKDDLNVDLLPEEVFMIEPYNETYNSDKLSTLVVKKELKEKYDEIYKNLDKLKVDFIKKLKSISKSTDCESEFIEAFQENEKEIFFDLLSKIYLQLEYEIKIEIDFKYNDIFDKKGNVKKFLDKHKQDLDEYITNYEFLISKSSFFKKSDNNTFGTYQAGEILKSIKDDSYFEAGHSLKLNTNEEITSSENYEKLVEAEIKKVLSDEKLKKAFDKIDKAIASNTELRAFKNVLEKNNLLLVELTNYENFKQKVWLSYFYQLKFDVKILVDSYELKKKELEDIIKEAIDTKTEWEDATKEFNERFKGIPFRLKIENQDDVILKTSTPTLKFIFKDPIEEKDIKKEDLLNVLSQGEKRALYLLNIIFEIRARKKLTTKSLFIIDDIADSFDYKNKYAIIEYLKDIADEPKFYQIILTHNFDFYRTLEGRFVGRKFSKMVSKSIDEISIIDSEYLKPFDYFKDKLDQDNKILIATIPFIRNLAEYTAGNTSNEFIKLTSLLHIKTDSLNLTINDLEILFKNILKNKSSLSLNNRDKKVIKLIFELAEDIISDTFEFLNLENKIVLSIAIRLKAEQFMIDKISNATEVNKIKKNQTIELIKMFKNKFTTENDVIELLEQVNLMTPENIHLNSFMYEPILDMSDDRLKDLYLKLKSLN